MQEDDFGSLFTEQSKSCLNELRKSCRRTPVWIELTPDEVQQARDYGDRVTALTASYGPNYTGGNFVEDRYFVGECGQIAVSKWARRKGLVFESTTRDDGESDSQDHLWYTSDGTVFTSNVKNSHHPRASLLLQPIAQAERYQHDYYIGATGKVRNGIQFVGLWGAISHNEWLKRRYVKRFINECWATELKYLPIAMDEFAELMK